MTEYKKFKKKDLIYLISLLRKPDTMVRRNTYPGNWVITNTWNGDSDPLGSTLSEIMDYIEGEK